MRKVNIKYPYGYGGSSRGRARNEPPLLQPVSSIGEQSEYSQAGCKSQTAVSKGQYNSLYNLNRMRTAQSNNYMSKRSNRGPTPVQVGEFLQHQKYPSLVESLAK
jgi:hypothetical protein